MTIIKCKMCGGDIELSEEKTFGVCEFCGSTMTLPKVGDEHRAAAFNRGNHFRRIGEFDKALTVYESLVRDDEADAEAHWCCALCRFGIEYVKDPVSGEYIPTCHRASFDNFLEDVDAKKAIECADVVARRQYEHDAKAIEDVRRGILMLSQSEKPYDVFICYKETDDKGQRTIDSQRAQEIYYQLTDQGRRVFFARITLEDKAGQQYEPYIFAALNSAKVMIVVGTRRENLEAVWVKNEWSRFLAIMKRDRKKLLIPCYADMDPYDMPEQLSVLQSYDMTKIGFIQDLIRGISKVLDADKKPVQVATTQEPSMPSNVKALLKRGYMSLEDMDWEKADGFFEQVLNQDAECAEAYVGKALASQKVKTLQSLIDFREKQYLTVKMEEHSITTDNKRADNAVKRWEIPNYLDQSEIRQIYEYRNSYESSVKHWTEAKAQEKNWWASERNLVRARQYSSSTFRQIVEEEYNGLMAFFDGKISEADAQQESRKKALEQEFAQFNENADRQVAKRYTHESERREREYADACLDQAKAEKFEDITRLEELVEFFSTIGDYKDSEKHRDDCCRAVAVIQERHRKEEADRLNLARRRKKKRTAIRCIIALIVIVVGVAVALTVQFVSNSKKYDSAEALFAKGELEEAIAAFTELGDFKNAAERANRIKYGKADALALEGEYDEAIAIFTELGDFEDAAERINRAKYEKADVLTSEGKYDEAIAIFTELGDYDNAVERANQAKLEKAYEKANDLQSKGNAREAAIAFGKIKDFKDAAKRSRELWEGMGYVVPIATGNYHTVAIKSDGTVIATGNNKYGQCNVSGWKDIVAVSAGNDYTIGLKIDGTVVVVGNAWRDVSDWTNIIAVSAGFDIYGLKSDGTVITTAIHDNGVSGWTDIIAISAATHHIVGLKSGGRVVAAGKNEHKECDISGYTNIADISTGILFSVGLKSDGTVVATGSKLWEESNVSEWMDIIDISASIGHIVGLKSDGTVVATGGNDSGECNVSSWRDIISISAGLSHTVGLKSDGTVVAVGRNDYGQCNVSDWNNIWVRN